MRILCIQAAKSSSSCFPLELAVLVSIWWRPTLWSSTTATGILKSTCKLWCVSLEKVELLTNVYQLCFWFVKNCFPMSNFVLTALKGCDPLHLHYRRIQDASSNPRFDSCGYFFHSLFHCLAPSYNIVTIWNFFRIVPIVLVRRNRWWFSGWSLRIPLKNGLLNERRWNCISTTLSFNKVMSSSPQTQTSKSVHCFAGSRSQTIIARSWSY